MVVKVKEEPTEDAAFLITEFKTELEDVSNDSDEIRTMVKLPVVYAAESLRKLPVCVEVAPMKLPSTTTAPAGKDFKCQFCEKRFVQKFLVAAHIKIDHCFQCQTCPSKFQYEISLIKHTVSEHGPSNFQQTTRKVNRNFCNFRFVCEICQLKFNDETTLNRHTLKHTSVVSGEKARGSELLISSIASGKALTKKMRTAKVKVEQIKRKRVVKEKSQARKTRSQVGAILSQVAKTKSQVAPIKKQTQETKRKVEESKLDIAPCESLPHWKFVLQSNQFKQYPGKKSSATDLPANKSDASTIPCADCGLHLLPDLMKLHYREYHEKTLQFCGFLCDLCGFEVESKIKLTKHLKTHLRKKKT